MGLTDPCNENCSEVAMFTEDDLLPISALQHYVFCPRQCALIHIEQAWTENRLTAQGRQLHERAHEAGPESRGHVRIVRSLRLCSRELGLTGQADVVELHRLGPESPPDHGATFPGRAGRWSVHPVEYKRGRSKLIDCDRIQLCAQAMCLEEMLGVEVPTGSLFYGRPRRRETIVFDRPAADSSSTLRERTRQAARDVHQLVRFGITPPAEHSRKCRSCSLIDTCLPKRTGPAQVANRYLRRQLSQALQANSAGEEQL